jgi:hypothetical protein
MLGFNTLAGLRIAVTSSTDNPGILLSKANRLPFLFYKYFDAHNEIPAKFENFIYFHLIVYSMILH